MRRYTICILSTVGKVRAGEIHNVVAGKAVIEGTVRSTDPDTRNRVFSALKRKVDGNASLYGVKAELVFPPALPALINTKFFAEFARKAARVVVDEKNVISQETSSLGGEDFSFYLQKISGCLVRFGAKKSDVTGHAHSLTFDFDEEVLPIGAAWYAKVALRFVQGK